MRMRNVTDQSFRHLIGLLHSLRPEIVLLTGHAVLVRPAVNYRRRLKISMRWRRSRSPLERRRVPGVLIDFLAPEHTAEEVDDKGNLRQTQKPRGLRDKNIQRLCRECSVRSIF